MTDAKTPADLAAEAQVIIQHIRNGLDEGTDITSLASEAVICLHEMRAALLTLEDERRIARENADGNAEGWRAAAEAYRSALDDPRASADHVDVVAMRLLDAAEGTEGLGSDPHGSSPYTVHLAEQAASTLAPCEECGDKPVRSNGICHLAAPMFKVGDRVRIARRVMGRDSSGAHLWVHHMDITIDEVGTIDRIVDGDLHVALKSDPDGWYYPAGALDLLPVSD